MPLPGRPGQALNKGDLIVKTFSKAAILVGVLVCVAAGNRAEAARIYNDTGRRIQVHQLSTGTTLTLGEYQTNASIIGILSSTQTEGDIALKLDSKDWTEDNGTRSPSITWDDPLPKGVVIATVGGPNLAPEVTVFCPNSDDDFQGGNYLIVTLEGEGKYLVAKMYDSNRKELWNHTTKN
jgi:hypothetical protein